MFALSVTACNQFTTSSLIVIDEAETFSGATPGSSIVNRLHISYFTPSSRPLSASRATRASNLTSSGSTMTKYVATLTNAVPVPTTQGQRPSSTLIQSRVDSHWVW